MSIPNRLAHLIVWWALAPAKCSLEMMWNASTSPWKKVKFHFAMAYTHRHKQISTIPFNSVNPIPLSSASNSLRSCLLYLGFQQSLRISQTFSPFLPIFPPHLLSFLCFSLSLNFYISIHFLHIWELWTTVSTALPRFPHFIRCMQRRCHEIRFPCHGYGSCWSCQGQVHPRSKLCNLGVVNNERRDASNMRGSQLRSPNMPKQVLGQTSKRPVAGVCMTSIRPIRSWCKTNRQTVASLLILKQSQASGFSLSKCSAIIFDPFCLWSLVCALSRLWKTPWWDDMLSFPGKLQGSCDPKIANNNKPDLIPTTQSVDGCFTLLHIASPFVWDGFLPIWINLVLPASFFKCFCLVMTSLPHWWRT